MASALIFIAGIFILIIKKFLKNKYYHVYTADELLKSSKLTNGKNSVYFTSGETRDYIGKYAICRTEFDKYLVCQFTKKFNEIRYFVLEYTAHGRVLAVQQIDEYNTGLNSKIITLHKRCASVNVVIAKVDDMEINTDVIRPLSRRNIRVYAFVKSFTLFAFLFVVRHIAIEILCKDALGLYLKDMLNYISVGVCFICGLLSYLVTVLCFRRKNVKALNGGAVEYEFV